MCIILIFEYLIVGYIIAFSWMLWIARYETEVLEDSGRALACAFLIPTYPLVAVGLIIWGAGKVARKLWKWLKTQRASNLDL